MISSPHGRLDHSLHARHSCNGLDGLVCCDAVSRFGTSWCERRDRFAIDRTEQGIGRRSERLAVFDAEIVGGVSISNEKLKATSP